MRRTVTYTSGLDELDPNPLSYPVNPTLEVQSSRPIITDVAVGQGFRSLSLFEELQGSRLEDPVIQCFEDKEDEPSTSDDLPPLPNDDYLKHAVDSFSTSATSAITFMLQTSFAQTSFGSAGRASPAEAVESDTMSPPVVAAASKRVSFASYDPKLFGRKSPVTPPTGKSILKTPASPQSATPMSTKSVSSDAEGLPPTYHPDGIHDHSGPSVSPLAWHLVNHFS